MDMLKKINKGVGMAATAMIIAGTTPQVVHAIPDKGNVSKVEAKAICKDIEKSIKNGTFKAKDLSKNIDSDINKVLKKDALHEMKFKILQENSNDNSMAGTYIKKVEHEVTNGKNYLVLSLDSIDWMKNIKASIDSEEKDAKIVEKHTKKVSDGKGKEEGKIRFEIKGLNSKILMHMNVEPMGNARVTFRVVLDNGEVKDLSKTEHNKKDIQNKDKQQKDNNKPKDEKKDKTSKESNLHNDKESNKDKTNKVDKKLEIKWGKVSTISEVTSVKLGKFYGGFDKYRIGFKDGIYNPNMKIYIDNFQKVTVNNIEYTKDISVEKSNAFYFGAMGLELNPSAFKEGENVLIFKSKGHNDLRLSINKNGNDIQIIKQQEGISTHKESDNELNGKPKHNIEDGIYTVGFKTYKVENHNETSMLGGFLDPNVKVEVKNGKIKLTFLHKVMADMLIDFRFESNGKYIPAKLTYYESPKGKTADKMKTLEVEVSDLTSHHNCGVLVTAMGGRPIDIGNIKKYKVAEMIFSDKLVKGWKGFEEKRAVKTKEEIFNDALVSAHLDKNHDGIVTDEEISLAKYEIELNSKRIKDISRLKNLGSKATGLDLRANEIAEIKEGTFDNAVNLEKLLLNCNEIASLPSNIFDKLTKLKTLDISENNLKKLPGGIFKNLKSLEELSIRECNLEELPDGIFKNLKNLRTLSLVGNKLSHIPKGIFDLSNLEALYINENMLEEIPNKLSELKKLKTIQADHNFINKIDNKFFDNIRKNNNVKILNIKDNELKELPEDMDKIFNFNSFDNDIKLNNVKNMPKFKESIMKKVYPQKSFTNFKAEVKGNKITWKSNLSILDMLCWERAVDRNSQDIKNVEEYKKYLTSKSAKVAQDILKKDGLMWEVVTDIQKKDADGKYVTIKTFKSKEDNNNGSYEDSSINEKSKYRVLKRVYGNTFEQFSYLLGQMAEVNINNEEKPSVKPEKPNKDDTFKQDEARIKTLPKIKSTRYGEVYGRVEYEIMLEDSKTINVVNYARSVSKLTVNGVEHEKSFCFGKDGYYLGYSGALEINDNSFTKAINTIIIKSDKYNTMVINIKKDGTLVSVKEIKSEKNKINTAPMLDIGQSLKIELGDKIDLMSGVSAVDEEDGEITNRIKINYGKLDINNPTKGTYNIIYSITDSKNETVTATRELRITGKEVSVDNLQDGVYTLNFKATRIEDETRSSMLEDFFDKNIKVTVKNGKITLTMLNTMHAYSLYDFRIESNNKFNKTIAKNYGEPNKKDGLYKMQTFEIPMDTLKGIHVGGVLVGMMGGYKNQIGDMDNYKTVKFIFSNNCTKGWDGFRTKEVEPNYDENLNKALLKIGLDKNKDGNVSNEEIALANDIVDLNQKELKDISKLKYMGDKVKSLQLNGNYIESLPQGIFDNLTELNELTINSNLLTTLDEHIFDKLTKLEYLAIDNNKLKKLPKNILSKLVNLKVLALSQNNLEELPDDLFTNNTKLTEIYLGDNKLKVLPKSLNQLVNLENLFLEDNDLLQLPIGFENLKKLKKLNVKNNKIINIPEIVYKNLKNLKELNLSNNYIENIPQDIGKYIKKLDSLNIKLNNIKNIPKLNIRDYEYLPQKNILNFKLKAENKQLTWNQDVSSLDILCWARLMYEKTPENLKEYKTTLNGKDVKELLKGKIDWKIETEIQKKNNNGEFITLNKITEEIKDDVLSGVYKDLNMKEKDQYRIIKTVKTMEGSGDKVFSVVAYSSVSNNTSTTTPEEPKDITKPIISKEKPAAYKAEVTLNSVNEEIKKIINKYLDLNKKIDVEVKNKEVYMTLTLMSKREDIKKLQVDGNDAEFEVVEQYVPKQNRLAAVNAKVPNQINQGKESTTIKFKIPNEKAKVKVTMNDKDTNKDESFEIKLKEDTIKEVSSTSNPVEKPSTTLSSTGHHHRHKKHSKESKEDEIAKPSEEVKDNKENEEDKKDNSKESKDTNVKEDKNNDVKASDNIKDNDPGNKKDKEEKKDNNGSVKKESNDIKKDSSKEVTKETKNNKNKVSNKEKSLSSNSTKTISNKKSTEIKEKKLPQTGMPFGSGLLGTIGSAIAGLGVILRRKNRKDKK